MHLTNQREKLTDDELSATKAKLERENEQIMSQKKDCEELSSLQCKLKRECLLTQKLGNASLAQRKKLEAFLCNKAGKAGPEGCDNCKRTSIPSDLSLPCLFEPKNPDHYGNEVGFMLQYAVLTCVRASDPNLRELAITNFRKLCKIDESPEAQMMSDIQLMVKTKTDQWQKLAQDMYDESGFSTLEVLATLLRSAVYCAMKTSPNCMERIMGDTIEYYRDSILNLSSFIDTSLSLVHASGIFSYLEWFSRFIIHAINPDQCMQKVMLSTEMWKFNTNHCPELVYVYKYGTNQYPWMEALIYNFNLVFSSLWTCDRRSALADGTVILELQQPTQAPMNKNGISLKKPLLPRLPKDAVCSQCNKKFPKSCKNLFPVCFQSSHSSGEVVYPREVACLERDESACSRDVEMKDMDNAWPREIRIVCSNVCLFKKMGGLNPEIWKIMKLDLPQHGVPCKDATWPEILDTVKYFSVRRQMEQHYYKKEYLEQRRKEKDRILMNTKENGSSARRTLPDTTLVPAEDVDRMTAEMRQYQENMLLHDPDDPDVKCKHTGVGERIEARFHPIQNTEAYITKLKGDGSSQACDELQISLEICDRIDFQLQELKNQTNILNDLLLLPKEENTLHLFNLSLTEVPVDFIRLKCNKLVVKGCKPNPKWQTSILNRHISGDQALLGLWSVDLDEQTANGLIICKSSEGSFFAFRPHKPKEFWDILIQDFSKGVLFSAIDAMVDDLLNNDAPSDEPVESRNWFLIKTFAIMQRETVREKLLDRFTEAGAPARFQILQSGLLLSETNRFTARHLVGCPHTLFWKGSIWTWRRRKGKVPWPFHTTAWALQCRESASEDPTVGNMKIIPEKFWSMVPKQWMIISVPQSKEIENLMAAKPLKICIELGSASEICLDDFRAENMMNLSIISESNTPHFAVQFSLIDGKLHGNIQDHLGNVKQIFDLVKDQYPDYDPKNPSFLRWEAEGDRKPGEPPNHLDKSLGNVLWIGELQLCLIQDESVTGSEMHCELRNLLRYNINQAVDRSQKEDAGSVRNHAFQTHTGHQVFSAYSSITSEHALPQNKEMVDLFTFNSKKGNASLVAFNVERKIIDSVIGTFKKCYFFYVHMQDNLYIHDELIDNKTTMVGFFLEPHKMTKELLAHPASDLGKRLMILRYDHRMGLLVAYVPKEKGKGQQLWEKLTQDTRSLANHHEKLFNKLKKTTQSQFENGRTTSQPEWLRDLDSQFDVNAYISATSSFEALMDKCSLSAGLSTDDACKETRHFLISTLKLAPDIDRGRSMRVIVQALIDGNIDTELFTKSLEKGFKSKHKPHLVEFLKKYLPFLRRKLKNGQMTIEGIRAPRGSAASKVETKEKLKKILLREKTPEEESKHIIDNWWEMTPESSKTNCKNFLETILSLATKRGDDTKTKALVQSLVNAKMEPEQFTMMIQRDFDISPFEPSSLVPFLENALPHLRGALASKEICIDGVIPPGTAIIEASREQLKAMTNNNESIIDDSENMTPDTAKANCAVFMTNILIISRKIGQKSQAPNLIQQLVDGQMTPEDFTRLIQVDLDSAPFNVLFTTFDLSSTSVVPFLNKTLPYLRKAMRNGTVGLDGVRPPREENHESDDEIPNVKNFELLAKVEEMMRLVNEKKQDAQEYYEKRNLKVESNPEQAAGETPNGKHITGSTQTEDTCNGGTGKDTVEAAEKDPVQSAVNETNLFSKNLQKMFPLPPSNGARPKQSKKQLKGTTHSTEIAAERKFPMDGSYEKWTAFREAASEVGGDIVKLNTIGGMEGISISGDKAAINDLLRKMAGTRNGNTPKSNEDDSEEEEKPKKTKKKSKKKKVAEEDKSSDDVSLEDEKVKANVEAEGKSRKQKKKKKKKKDLEEKRRGADGGEDEELRVKNNLETEKVKPDFVKMLKSEIKKGGDNGSWIDESRVHIKKGSEEKSSDGNNEEENEDPQVICWKCHVTKNLSRCRGCKKVRLLIISSKTSFISYLQARYCSEACQKADWGRHGEYCTLVMERRNEKRRAAEGIITIT